MDVKILSSVKLEGLVNQLTNLNKKEAGRVWAAYQNGEHTTEWRWRMSNPINFANGKWVVAVERRIADGPDFLS